MYPSLLLPVTDKSQTSGARRTATVWVREAGGADDQVAQVALIVTELANNLALHTTHGGVLLLRRFDRDGQVGIEVQALDDGPGTANFGTFMRDGYSTAGTPGTGLGAVERASQVFEVHSQAEIGTALLSRIWPKKSGDSKGGKMQVGAVNLPKRGETLSGDSWCYCEGEGGRSRLIVADGLGHGPLAAEASRMAVGTFAANRHLDLPRLMETLDSTLRGTRGAAVAVAELDPARGSLRYVGVGNIAASLLTHTASSSMVSMNGAVGVRCPSIREFSYPLAAGTLFVMCSDGLKSQWKLNRYHGLLNKHPALIAGVLYRDNNRDTDDTTVVVIQIGK